MTELFMPRKLPRTREYPGYQFYCELEKRNASSGACFCFAVLCVIDWLKQRLRETDVIPEEISRLPGHEQSRDVEPEAFRSFTLSSGFSAYVVSLPEHGVWTLRLKEPDSDTAQRKAVPGRFFTTNVGLHVLNDQRVELGIRIDVTDPDQTPEVDFAFRPRFVRDLYAQQDISVIHADTVLPYSKALTIENEEDLKLLKGLLDSSECAMPVIMVSQAIRFPEVNADTSLRNRLFAPPPLFSSASPASPIVEQYYPFDADDIASHSFGHAIVFRAAESCHPLLAKRLKKEYSPGDIVLVEPKRFGRAIRTIDQDDKDAVNQIWQYTHSFSKDRKYPFGTVMFEYDARNVESRELISRIRASGDLKAEEKLDQLNRTIDRLQSENEKKAQKIDELRDQLLSEYKRGEAAEKAQNEHLSREYEECRENLRKARANVSRLEQENRSARALRGAAEALRSMDRLPESNEDVVNYFKSVFKDRIAFTERGEKSACKSDIKTSGLWFYLYRMATSLYDIHHASIPDVEKEFYAQTGIEAAMSEGSQSRKDNKIMNLRMDTYDGKEVSMEPHVKLHAQKAGAEHRRIYYCYDHELDRIIIGWVGDHLKTAGTVHLS